MGYAYLCTDCDHMASDHRLVGADIVAGPYRCTIRDCACEQPQEGAFVPLSRVQYERWLAQHGEEQAG